MHLNYIEAIRKLPTNFTTDEINQILKKAGGRFTGRLRKTFEVISDDMVTRRGRGRNQPEVSETSSDVPAGPSPDEEMTLESEVDIEVVQTGSGGSSGSSGVPVRGKRVADSPASGASVPKR
jgi:hypothetical protein